MKGKGVPALGALRSKLPLGLGGCAFTSKPPTQPKASDENASPGEKHQRARFGHGDLWLMESFVDIRPPTGCGDVCSYSNIHKLYGCGRICWHPKSNGPLQILPGTLSLNNWQMVTLGAIVNAGCDRQTKGGIFIHFVMERSSIRGERRCRLRTKTCPYQVM